MSGAADVWKISVLFIQFFCDPKTALKKKVYLKKKKRHHEESRKASQRMVRNL